MHMCTTSLHAEELQIKAKEFSVQDISKFLQSIKLDQYASAFEEFEVSGELLIQFQDDELKEVGVISALHRLKIRVYFRRLVLGSKELADQYPPKMIAQFLEESKQLKQFASSFLENEIDGEMLDMASDEVLKELGVEMGVHMRMIRTKLKSHLEVKI